MTKLIWASMGALLYYTKTNAFLYWKTKNDGPKRNQKYVKQKKDVYFAIRKLPKIMWKKTLHGTRMSVALNFNPKIAYR